MEKFRTVLDDCGLKNVKADADFSQTNHRKGEAAVWELLDHFLINEQWALSLGITGSQVLDYYDSDHRAIQLTLVDQEMGGSKGGYKRFYFEHKWMVANNFTINFLMEWRFSGGLPIHKRLEWCQEYLKKWKNLEFDNPTKKIEELRKKRVKLLNVGAYKNTSTDLVLLEANLERMLEAEVLHWKQQSRANWLDFGDRNTTYFHTFASAWKKKNTILTLLDQHGKCRKMIR
ncbi:uncharacterized protein LOC131023234 [Salvia miltiorrhiza]|uniref:uncharacterized protein LOC131023234 n=1 Tax=Salvia miltiorrhiza TaxID=226208 RepID=UPI0025AD0011|nr:uncharacterized protein LOC131023234 [Salvia miltiorrhiza]